jgi:hypothetical protein
MKHEPDLDVATKASDPLLMNVIRGGLATGPDGGPVPHCNDTGWETALFTFTMNL